MGISDQLQRFVAEGVIGMSIVGLEGVGFFGAKLAGVLRAGDVVFLDGPLGAGKTTLVRAVALAMGSLGDVSSPTFTIVNQYPGPIPIVHMDLFRLRTPADVANLDLDRYWGDGRSVKIVEWAEKLGDHLPGLPVLTVMLEVTGDHSRQATWRYSELRG